MQRKAGGSIEWEVPQAGLLAFVGTGNAEAHSAVIIGLDRGLKVEIGKRNFLMLGSEGPQRLSDDSVVLNFLLVLITEHQHGRGQHGCRLIRLLSLLISHRRMRPASIGILVPVHLFMAEHSLLFDTALVHFVGVSAVSLVIFIVVRAGIPPPGIDVANAPPRIAIPAPAIKSEAVAETVVETIATESMVEPVESVMKERPAREAGVERMARIQADDGGTTNSSRTSTREVSAAEATVTGKTAEVTTAKTCVASAETAGVTSAATLRKRRECREQQDQRRNGEPVTHDCIIPPFDVRDL